MAGAGELRYFTIRPSHKNRVVDATVVSGEHQSINVFMPVKGFYAPNALTPGDFLARTGPVAILERTLQLVGELSNAVASYPNPKVRVQDVAFKRILAFLVKITDDTGVTVGRLLRVFWAQMSDELEDPDLVDRAEGPKAIETAKRKRQRDVNYRLKWLMNREKEVSLFRARFFLSFHFSDV